SAGMLPGSVRYYLAQEDRRQVLLPDHSQVQLNQRTSLVYLGFRDQRQVMLRNGEAFFDVQHNPEQPFVIRADNASIRVTGTHFNVWTGQEFTTVTVTQGSVLASRNDGSRDNNQGAVLTAGMQAVFGPDRMVQSARIDPSRAAAWRNGKLMLDDVSLREALPLINRYLDVPLTLADNEVGDLRFGGTYDTADIDQLVVALPKILPVKLRHSDQATLLIRR
ncbi:MAG: FecR family protein, partial [Pseudomonas sp.]